MNLQDAQVVVLAENLYQELELWTPLFRLREAGANALVVAPSADAVYASKLGYPIKADLAITEVDASQIDCVVIPGGFAPENFRRTPQIQQLVKKVHEQGSLVAAICHAGWTLASAGIARGKRMTCVGLIKDDIINAGGNWVDEAVVIDGNLLTSRLPSDLPQFCAAIVKYLEEHPSKRDPKKNLERVPGRAASTADYTQPARFVTTPVGKASANYRQHAVLPK